MRRSYESAFSFVLLGTLALLCACSGGGGFVPTATTPDDPAAHTVANANLIETWSHFASGIDWLDGTDHGQWFDQWDGYGRVDVVGRNAAAQLELSPEAATSGDHSALVTSLGVFSDFTATVPLTTRKQLSSSPNPWEVGWVLWHYGDNTHFYAFTPQPNGWELSKEDPAYPGDQRFLLTSSTPTFPIGATYTVRVAQAGASMTVWVNGVLICTYTDTERPYASGSLGLYTEEATVDVGALSVVRATI